MERLSLLSKDNEYEQINQLYAECLHYLNNKSAPSDWAHDFLSTKEKDDKKKDIAKNTNDVIEQHVDVIVTKEELLKSSQDDLSVNEPVYEIIDEVKNNFMDNQESVKIKSDTNINYKMEYERKASNSSLTSERLRKLSGQLPKIVITQSQSSPNVNQIENTYKVTIPESTRKKSSFVNRNPPSQRNRTAYGEYSKRLVSKNGIENVALISNVPFEKIRLLNDTFHTLINLRWRWIVIGTVVVHFAIWLIFAVFWYIAAMAHYDFEPNPPNRTCVTGGKDFVTIFLASVEAQTTIGFGDRAIDEECPESIFLFIMQLILGTGLSGVLTCVVYAKLTRPEKLSRDGVGFSKKAVICLRDGKLCLMIRAWDLNYDHIICSEFSAHFIHTHRTKEGEVVRYFARSLPLQQRQFLLWPVTLVHEIDETSPLFRYSAKTINTGSFEITVSLKGASASMGTYTQSQTSYLPKEIVWGHRYLPVVRYDNHKQKYVIEHKKLDDTEPVNIPTLSAHDLYRSVKQKLSPPATPGTPGSFFDQVSGFQLERSSSFRIKSSRA